MEVGGITESTGQLAQDVSTGKPLEGAIRFVAGTAGGRIINRVAGRAAQIGTFLSGDEAASLDSAMEGLTGQIPNALGPVGEFINPDTDC